MAWVWFRLVIVFALACAMASFGSGTGVPLARAQTAAEAANGPPLTIAVLVSTRTDRCYDPGDAAAIAKLAAAEQDRLNSRGGIHGRLIQIRILDDRRDTALATANLRSALVDPSTLAIVGMTNSSMAKGVFDAIGPEIRDSGIPYLSGISVASLFESYPNVFTMRPSQEDERVPAMTQFIRRMAIERPAFVGLDNVPFSAAIGDGLKASLAETSLIADHRLRLTDGKISAEDIATVVADLKQKSPDLVVLGVGTARSAALVEAMRTAGVTPAVFLVGQINGLPAEVSSRYPNAMYQLAWDRLPEVHADRLLRRILREGGDRWLFDGTKMTEARGWIDGTCKPRDETVVRDPLGEDNMRVIGNASQHADMVAIAAIAANATPRSANMGQLRAAIVTGLKTTYAVGRGALRGSFQNWSFNPISRVAARPPFIVIQPAGLGRTQLAPIQFVRLRDGNLRNASTLYLDIDLIRTYRVDDNEKTFFAEFYLSMHNDGSSSIEQIEFTNAYLDPRTGGRQLTIEELHGGGRSSAYPDHMKVYKVAGRFFFEPELAAYPFDTQRFTIDLQPRKRDAPFVVQPPPVSLRDRTVGTDGWDPKSQYVTHDEDFVPVLDAYTHAPSIVPFYRASFVWLMKRQTTDYFLRVVVPLAFILIVAYLSIFIPAAHFEAIVTIQVTALLSAVALYLSLPKLDSDTATMSDRMFVFNYMMVSLMIVLSILRVNRMFAANRWARAFLGFVHIVLIPALVVAAVYYVLQITSTET